ncbi:MAG: SpoVG family protein [Paenibacillus macerans]|nr:SpoVG family protein [Paenibacillus macerans]
MRNPFLERTDNFGPICPEVRKENFFIMSNEKTTVPQEAEQQPGQAALPLKLDVTARLIEPKGNLVGFASLKLNDCFVIDDFKILQNDKGIFVGMPSKPDKTSKTGYRDTSRPITKEFRAELTEAVTAAYHAELEKLQTRAAAIASPEKQSIPKQLAEGAKQAAQENAAQPAPVNTGKAKNAER